MTDKLTESSFDEWLDFNFKRLVPQDRAEPDDPFEQYRVGYGKRFLEHSTRLFRNPTILLDRYRPEQIEQGLWTLSLEELGRWIWEKEIDWPIRKDCIMAMAPLFEQLFAKDFCGHACYMWWDHLRNFEDNSDPNVSQAMLETLSKILEMDSHDCQTSALHGLGHLKNPAKGKLIEMFLSLHPDLDDQTKQYAEAAKAGRVL